MRRGAEEEHWKLQGLREDLNSGGTAEGPNAAAETCAASTRVDAYRSWPLPRGSASLICFLHEILEPRPLALVLDNCSAPSYPLESCRAQYVQLRLKRRRRHLGMTRHQVWDADRQRCFFPHRHNQRWRGSEVQGTRCQVPRPLS